MHLWWFEVEKNLRSLWFIGKYFRALRVKGWTGSWPSDHRQSHQVLVGLLSQAAANWLPELLPSLVSCFRWGWLHATCVAGISRCGLASIAEARWQSESAPSWTNIFHCICMLMTRQCQKRHRAPVVPFRSIYYNLPMMPKDNAVCQYRLCNLKVASNR